MTLSAEVVRRHGRPVFIETGSHRGNGIATALDCGAEEVWSADIILGHVESCRSRFPGNPKVHLYHADSLDMLAEVLPHINSTAFVWLDAHDENGIGPLCGEIELLKAAPVRHVIAIDDICLLDVMYHGSLTDLKDNIASSDSNYAFYLEDCCRPSDILVAVPESLI